MCTNRSTKSTFNKKKSLLLVIDTPTIGITVCPKNPLFNPQALDKNAATPFANPQLNPPPNSLLIVVQQAAIRAALDVAIIAYPRAQIDSLILAEITPICGANR